MTARRFLPLVILLLACRTLLAGDTFTPHDLLRMRSVTVAVISPDGKQVAYVLSVPRDPFKDKDGPAYSELHVVNIEGVSRPYVTGHLNVAKIAWLPGSERIAFLAKRESDKQPALYVIPLTGGEAQKLIEFETTISGFSFSPDGKQLAFLAAQPETKELKDLKEKGFNQEIHEEDKPPTRVWIADVPAANGPAKEGAKPRMLDLKGSASVIHWSPAGGKLAVALAPTPLIDDELMHRMVHILDVATGKVAAKLDHPAKLGQIAWSPHGKHIATIIGEDIHDPSEGALLLWTAEGKKAAALPAADAVDDALPERAGWLAAADGAEVRRECQERRADHAGGEVQYLKRRFGP